MNTISTLSTADLTKAWHIEKRAHAFPWSEQTLASNQGERYRNYQLSVDGEMAAFAITQVVLDEATLFNIAVDPAYQRRGLGRALLEHVIDEVEKLGVVTLWLEVRASNVAAIALYESVGFNEATIRRNYYPTTDGREDAIIMALPIRMFLDYSVTFTAEDFQDYQAVNKPLWVDYQNGAITSLQLQHQRFDSWAERLNVPPGELNDAFMNAMAEICAPLPGAVSLLNALQGKVRMGIITNGFTSLQQTRLERTGLRDHFDLLIISEQVGVAKPDARIFDYALAQAGNPPRSRVLMVGDTAESDIRGGVNAGLATCWLNAHQRELPADLEPDWTVTSLSELEQLLCKH